MFKNNLINRKESNISCSCASSGWKGRSLLFAASISWWLSSHMMTHTGILHSRNSYEMDCSSYQCSTAILVHSVHYLVYVRIISYNCISRSRYCLLIQPTEILYIHTEQRHCSVLSQTTCMYNEALMHSEGNINHQLPFFSHNKIILSWCLPIG